MTIFREMAVNIVYVIFHQGTFKNTIAFLNTEKLSSLQNLLGKKQFLSVNLLQWIVVFALSLHWPSGLESAAFGGLKSA